MEVSVIVPVYNAENFVEKAVESALLQEQTKEIIIIEDGSNDTSFFKCIEIKNKNKKVKLFQHPNNENLGISASRNLGIKNANCEYIAFLDSDDSYLPNFFNEAEKIFSLDENINGVFGTIGCFFYDNSAKMKHLERIGFINTGINFDFDYRKDNLFDLLQQPNNGHFSIIGLVFKKSIIKEIGYFDEKLKQSEDTDFLWRLSLFGKLQSIQRNKVIALRGVHKNNSVFKIDEYQHYQFRLLKKWVYSISKYHISKKSSKILIQKYLTQFNFVKFFEPIVLIRIALKVLILIGIFFKKPQLLFYFLKK